MLDEGVKILKRHSDLKVEIAGHTDSQGDDVYNQGLSERRAQAVADYLIAHGANGANITVKGYGESEPVADNGTMEGRAANRRVELRH
jgi:OOP family OmpA-OmpF porin